MPKAKPRVIVIVGATGSGKSDLAVAVAREYDGEIICADSRTIYRGMNIGTAKARRESAPPPPTPPPGGRGREEGRYLVCGIPHHLTDIRDPDEPYSAAEFKADAERCIREIVGRGRLPIVVGGTMLYIKALVDDLNFANVAADGARRAELETLDLTALQRILRERDADAAALVDSGNKRRVIRVIETIEGAGRPLRAARGAGESSCDFLQIGLDVDRDTLRERIAGRTRAMFAGGLVAEVQGIVAKYGMAIEPLRGAVYRHVVAWLAQPEAERVPQEAVEQQINSALRAYARRQLAWFRKDARIHWVITASEAQTLIAQFLA